MIVENRYTGEKFEVDAFELRLKRHRRKVKLYCDLMEKQNCEHIMITLTYRDEKEYGKRDVTNFIAKIKRRLGSNLYGYTWVAEVQKRGAEKGGLHYHVILAVKKGIRINKPDKTGMWTKGMTKVELARTVYYVLKYAGKEYQKKGLPKGHRLFATWISKVIELTSGDLFKIKKSRLPFWVVKIIESRDDWKNDAPVEKSVGGSYWIDGMLFNSPYWILSY